MSCPYYELYERPLTKHWTLYVWVTRRGKVVTKMAVDYTGVESLKATSKFLERVDRILNV
jgi:hypothetical protein